MQTAASHKNPVVLVHGIYNTGVVFWRLKPYLEKLGWAVYTIDLKPANGTAPVEMLAEQLRAFVETTFAPDEKIDLLGFSLGAMVSRYYLQRLGGLEKVERFIAVSAPHYGTQSGYFLDRAVPRQMRPDSDFIADLNRDADKLGAINFTSLWTPFDLMIFPAERSRFHVGKVITRRVPMHFAMVIAKTCLEAVAAEFSRPLENPASKKAANFIES